MDEIVKEFIVESTDNLDQLERDLVDLEEKGANSELIARIFRVIHTIKGTTGFLGFSKLESLAHAGESLLSSLREGAIGVSPEVIGGLSSLADASREMLVRIETYGSEGDIDCTALIESLSKLRRAEPRPLRVASLPPKDAAAPWPKSVAACAGSNVAAPGVPFGQGGDAEGPRVPLGQILVEAGIATEQEVRLALVEQAAGDPRHLGEILIEHGVVKPADIVGALQAQKDSGASPNGTSVRVDVGQLDRLLNLVGELALVRNQIVAYAAQNGPELPGEAQRLDLITSELQESVMKLRLQPVANLFGRFPRVVRELAAACGKRIRVEMEGKETELDRTLLEAIRDPMMHIVRNAVDHGIETPEKRVAAGKPVEGRLRLRAVDEGSHVTIEISDDGEGIDCDKVRRKALEKKFITPAQADSLGERDILALLFQPGLTTAATVTNVSGRGVGMDVVKAKIEGIGGSVDVLTKRGKGTTLTLKLPLTLAVIPVLMTTCGGEWFAIPQVNILQVVRLRALPALRSAEPRAGTETYRWRDCLLPLVYLSRELMLPEGSGIRTGNGVCVVVLRAGKRKFGLIVDETFETGEVVARPLGKEMQGMEVYAGATTRADGRIALILDIRALARRARDTSLAPVATQRNRLEGR